MSETSFIDVFKLCWDVIVDESFLYDGTFFSSEHCKINDSTDTNFDVPENRQAYAYKYGCYNTLFFEKCFLNFLNECPDFETIFPLKNLKVCSLSNGPGFDIVGLLCALCASGRPLKSVWKFNAVNLYYSWSTLYETLIFKACNSINLKLTNNIQIKRENIGLIQGDIFSSTLSTEVKNCIRSSNVLLMVKVFFCSRTTVNKFTKCLMKIFLPLKPGALIFFIGSEKNIDSFTRRRFLSNYVKNIYGPQKVTLDNIMMNKNCSSVSNVRGQKPVDSGSAQFVVWQKRNPAEIEELLKDSKVKGKKMEGNKTAKRTRKRKSTLKKQTSGDDKSNVASDDKSNVASDDKSNVASDDNYSSDSEMSFSSRSRLSDVSTDALKYSSSSNLSDLARMRSKVPPTSQSNSSSIENIISILDKSDLECIKKDEHKTDCSEQSFFQYYSNDVSDFKNGTCREACANILDKSVVHEALHLSYSSDKDNCDLDLMKQETSQTLDYSVSVINKPLSLSDKHCCDQDPSKQENMQISDNGIIVVNGALNSDYADDKGHSDLHLMKQEGTQVLDNGVSVVNDASNLSCHDNVHHCEQNILNEEISQVSVNDVSRLKYAHQEEMCDLDLINQTVVKILDNAMSEIGSETSLSRVSDKGNCANGIMKQGNAQNLDDGMSMVNEASSLSYAYNKVDCNRDRMKQESIQDLGGNAVFVLNHGSSSKYADDKDLNDPMKKGGPQILDDSMSMVNDASNVSYANNEDRCHVNQMNQVSLQCLDASGVLLLNDASSLKQTDDKDFNDLMKKAAPQVLDDCMSVVDGVSSLNYADDKDYCDNDLMKQGNAQILDNDMSVVKDASSLSCENDKDHCNHDQAKQENAQVLDDGMSMINEASIVSSANIEDHYNVHQMKQASSQCLDDNGASLLNDASSLRYADDKDFNDLMKKAAKQVLDHGTSTLNEASSLNYANNEGRCDVDQMKKPSSQSLDASDVSELNESSILRYVDDKDFNDLVKKAATQVSNDCTSVLNDASNRLNYADDKDYCDNNVMKRENAEILDNDMSVLNDASSISYKNKDHCNHDGVKQKSTQVLDDSMSMVNKASSVSYANNEDRYNVDQIQKASSQSSDVTNMSVLNESSSLKFADDRYDLYGLMKQASILDNNAQGNNCNSLYLKPVRSTSKNLKKSVKTQCTNLEISSENPPIEGSRDVTKQFRNRVLDGKMTPRNEPEINSQHKLSSPKQFRENVITRKENTSHPLATQIQNSCENLDVGFPNLHSLIRQCEHLVVEFEKLIVSFQSDIDNSRKDSNFNNHHHCHHHHHQQQVGSEFSHHCCCCSKIVHTCCCRNRHNK